MLEVEVMQRTLYNLFKEKVRLLVNNAS